MRRFRDPSHLRRACASSRRPWSTQERTVLEKYPRGIIIKEKIEPTRRRFPVFELSDVVLDLDAEGSPHVRPFDDQDAVQQQAKWGYDPAGNEVLLRVGNLRKHMARDGKLMHHQASRPDTLQSISDYDVLAIALLGGSSVSSSLEDFKTPYEQSQRCRPITLSSLRTNGIPERVLAGDANKVITFMLHRQQLARTKEDTGGLEAFDAAIRHFKHLSQLRKLCSGRTSASSGQKGISHASIDHIVHTLRSMPPQPPEDVLKFVNNFTIRQLSKNAGLNASMSLYGLEIASKISLLPSIMQYLQICLSQGFIGNDNRNTATLETVGHGILTALEKGQGTARGTRPGLFTLFTGRSLTGSSLQPALFGLDFFQRQEDPKVHHLYVRLLAELGALRLLWHSGAQYQDNIGVTAFIRCGEVLSSANGDTSVDYTTATGGLEKDADLDLQTINNLDAYHTSATSTRAPYPSHVKGLTSPDEVKKVFESRDIHQAMTLLGELISRTATMTQSE